MTDSAYKVISRRSLSEYRQCSPLVIRDRIKVWRQSADYSVDCTHQVKTAQQYPMNIRYELNELMISTPNQLTVQNDSANTASKSPLSTSS